VLASAVLPSRNEKTALKGTEASGETLEGTVETAAGGGIAAEEYGEMTVVSEPVTISATLKKCRKDKKKGKRAKCERTARKKFGKGKAGKAKKKAKKR
jgi:hypothetical protein